MEILKWLMENYNVDEGYEQNDLEKLKNHLKTNFNKDDCVEFVNILVLLEELPDQLTQVIWDRLETTP